MTNKSYYVVNGIAVVDENALGSKLAEFLATHVYVVFYNEGAKTFKLYLRYGVGECFLNIFRERYEDIFKIKNFTFKVIEFECCDVSSDETSEDVAIWIARDLSSI